ncbi:UDP-N-acetylmuramate--L-alanine ligase [Chloracidobacterium thermophilum]|uniref:UDP-N-acetylmuramate--L-alanine ligase n=1 Tax=Chloracidobacterium thermophilum (strain B) TaxID=981222 RepID=G2LFJ8_CHLTF|nr:UDP-N-acetylmuramate--L-alanine ligase [Chloracidobacterium thermophilum]AEP11399.1 UDP-N-acetylmuramate--L-alanine ligase [Chloracidobacterium thermophilum B]QUV79302.1 UDP-N-acetylmuramate--L-alanine ligase [Chloracidobacterium thermophilum]
MAEHLHFIGIGGSGMSSIAEVALRRGWQISGSDLAASATTARLQALGAQVFIGHAPEQLGDAQRVVVSTAVKADNPERLAAQARGIPIVHRAEMLAELMAGKVAVAVAGAHGKTTTSAMVATILRAAGQDPTAVIGAAFADLGSGAMVGTGPHFVAEADESDGSFLKLPRTLAIITNVDRDHLDFYRDFDAILDHFVWFAEGVPETGVVIACADDAGVQALLPRLTRRCTLYGIQAAEAQIRAADIVPQKPFGWRFTVWRGPACLGPVRLRVPGRHAIHNALAAIAAGLELGLDFKDVQTGLEMFENVSRRFQIRGERNNVLVIDDYGHHPVEIAAVLDAARSAGRRIVLVFQPHRYTRTQHLFAEFVTVLREADVVCIVDIYPAGETPLPGVTAAALAAAVQAAGHPAVQAVGALDAALPAVAAQLRPGDVLLTVGAGNVWQLGERFLQDAQVC